MLSAPKLSSTQLKAANAVCRLAAIAAREFGADLTYGGSVSGGEEMMQLVIGLNGTEASLLLSPQLLQRAARGFYGLVRDYEMPNTLVAPALEASAASWIARVEEASGLEISVRRMSIVKSEAIDSAIWFTLPALPGANMVGIVAPQTLALPKLPAAPWSGSDQLRLRLPLIVADVGLTLAELSELREGDLVVLAGLAPKDVARVHLAVSPGTAIIGQVDGRKLTLERLGKSMSTTDAATGAKPASPPKAGAEPAAGPNQGKEPAEPLVPTDSIEALPLKVVFDLGDVELTVAELRGLVPGQTIDLAREPGSAVRITVNGARIGAGEIVEIDGRLGVRITELAGRNERPAT
jgi:type III secretion system YscQ/HrcQ family protein